MGRLYVTCIIGLLPDKKLETYESFFGLIWNYLSQNNLPNNFADGFFMTDFEQNIRSGFQLFWPEVRLLGCYFHFSQLIWRRVKSEQLFIRTDAVFRFQQEDSDYLVFYLGNFRCKVLQRI